MQTSLWGGYHSGGTRATDTTPFPQFFQSFCATTSRSIFGLSRSNMQTHTFDCGVTASDLQCPSSASSPPRGLSGDMTSCRSVNSWRDVKYCWAASR
jgi:hypothetical protein